jgi:hypothetical protein
VNVQLPDGRMAWCQERPDDCLRPCRPCRNPGAERSDPQGRYHAPELELLGVEASVEQEIRRIGGRKYLLRLGRLRAQDEGSERWKADLHRIWLGRPTEEPELCLVRSTKEA